jgi:hypothetical protein
VRVLIRTDGSEHPLEDRRYSFEEIYKLIGCTCVTWCT